MARGRQITAVIEVEFCTAGTAAEEFFKKNKIKNLSVETQKDYFYTVNPFVLWYGADNPVHKIDAKIIDKYTEYKLDNGLKMVSIASLLKHIRRFINFCAERNYLKKFEVEIPKVEEELKDPYTPEEMKKLLKRPTSDNWVEWRNWCLVNYFYSTGQRLSTVINLKRSDLDIENKRIKLRHNKDKKPKYMPLSTAIVKVLEEYLRLSGLDDEDYLFPEYEGGQLKKRSIEDAIKDYNTSRGVTKTSIHLFRHTFAKEYIMAGGNPAKLQKLLNHKTIDMTMKYVNLYGCDVANDLDLYNPLDNIKRGTSTKTKRVKIG